jgi:2-oxoglutarate dehydrogenase E1 component
LVLHGDAAMTGQGVVSETLNLADLQGYTVGGTVHIVINNQVGFTTDPRESRSSLYATSVAQMLDIPIFHVNGDDPEACVHVIRLAMQYRQAFNSDVVVDLYCFRRYGHNENDEPAFTQPKMYEIIQTHPGVRQLYATQLVQRGKISQADADGVRSKCQGEFQESYSRVHKERVFREPSALEGLWASHVGGPDKGVPPVKTGVNRAQLVGLLTELAETPSGFNVHPTLQKVLQRRRQMAAGTDPLDWAAGELLAYATLLTQGTRVRLSGQDSERGTFTHRHSVLHDYKTGARYGALERLTPNQAHFEVYNSPLSELGCLGFEYGYSLDSPDALVVWEAQYGDFANGAQVIIDQFMVASEHKWKRLSGLTLLLPHGYEGQGPEHSSARLERFLELCGNDNIQVCYPTTPAQIFHLLRRQVLRPIRKPLVVMSPKSLLRNPRVTSSLDDLAEGAFHPVIPDAANVDLEQVTRVLLCTGKVFYDLSAERERTRDLTVGIVRVEQLYPFPREELAALLARMPHLAELWWVQEEPSNMGAWRYVLPLLSELALGVKKAPTPSVGFVGRAESASPATGYLQAHELEQKLLVQQALTREAKNGR